MLKTAAITFGVIFLALGVLGFIPAVAPGGMLLGLFEVGPMHNLVHLATGAVALAVGFASQRASRLYFQIFGVIYGLVALLGFFYGDAPLLGLMAHNWGDVWFHVIVAAVSLYLGFGYREHSARPVAGHA
jgi:hypothetical protein